MLGGVNNDLREVAMGAQVDLGAVVFGFQVM